MNKDIVEGMATKSPNVMDSSQKNRHPEDEKTPSKELVPVKIKCPSTDHPDDKIQVTASEDASSPLPSPKRLRKPNSIFCCSWDNLRVLGNDRNNKLSPHCQILWNFALCMSNLRCTPEPTPPMPPHLLAMLLFQVTYCIKLETWTDGEKVKEQYFAPHLYKEDAFKECSREDVVRAEFSWNWKQLKTRCVTHWRTMFVLKFMDKGDGMEEVEILNRSVDPGGEPKRSEMEHEVGEDGYWICGPGLSRHQRIGFKSKSFDLVHGGIWLD